MLEFWFHSGRDIFYVENSPLGVGASPLTPPNFDFKLSMGTRRAYLNSDNYCRVLTYLLALRAFKAAFYLRYCLQADVIRH